MVPLRWKEHDVSAYIDRFFFGRDSIDFLARKNASIHVLLDVTILNRHP